MKNKMIYALGAMMLVGVASCDLTEKPSSFYEKDTYFVTEGKAQMAVVGIYDCLETTDYYGQNIMPFFGSDDMFMVRGTGSDGTRRDISHYLYNASNTWIASVWRCAYQALDRANVAIASIEAMSGFAENKNLQEIDGQARFLRAYIAFDLVKFFGDVPFSTEYTNGFANTSKPRTDRELIYDQIIEDLNYAKTYLKSGREVASSEIPCSGAAHTLLMRVYLQRAGYSLNCSSRQLTRPDDTTRKGYFEAVIKEWEALKAEGYHGFYAGGYEQLFKNYSQLTLDNQESLWEIAFEPNQGLKDNAGVWATYNGPLVDAPGSYPGTSSYMGRANAFFVVLPYWKSFYESNEDGSIKDVQKAHHLVDDGLFLFLLCSGFAGLVGIDVGIVQGRFHVGILLSELVFRQSDGCLLVQALAVAFVAQGEEEVVAVACPEPGGALHGGHGLGEYQLLPRLCVLRRGGRGGGVPIYIRLHEPE